MKLHIASDLHNEFGQYYGPTVEADVYIIAGDLSVSDKNIVWYLNHVATKYKHVIYVVGNHEFYHKALHWRPCKELLSNNVHFLDNETVTIEGKTFYGGTMWSDLNTPVRVLPVNYRDYINDFSLIKNLTENTMRRAHGEFKYLMPSEVDVVISHFVPSIKHFTHEKYKDSKLNPYFSCSDMEPYFDRCKLWVFGHTHDSWDKTIDNTRFICNPKGYSHELNMNFNPELVYDI